MAQNATASMCGGWVLHTGTAMVPPTEVLAERLDQEVRAQVADTVRDAILAENDYAGRAEAECSRLAPHLGREAGELSQVVRTTLGLKEHEHLSWANVVDDVAIKVTRCLDLAALRPIDPATVAALVDATRRG